MKNKKEIWKADAKVKSMREKAKKLISADAGAQKKLFDQLNKIGIKVESIADVLGLELQDYLNRRLQTVILNKGIANKIKHARQMITHKKVLVNGKVVSTPSYIVPVAFEDKITTKKPKVKVKKVEEKPADAAPVEEAPKEEAKSEEKKDE